MLLQLHVRCCCWLPPLPAGFSPWSSLVGGEIGESTVANFVGKRVCEENTVLLLQYLSGNLWELNYPYSKNIAGPKKKKKNLWW